MSKKKLQEKKKKIRERTVQQKKAQQRLFNTRRARYEREIVADVVANREKMEPIRNKTHMEKIEEHLEKNMEVLKALEQEYITAQATREDVHSRLEAEGYSSLEDKMAALKAKATVLAEQLKEEMEMKVESA